MLQAQSLRLRARKKSGDLTTAIVPAGTSFPAVSREPCDLPSCALRGSLLRRPVELGAVDPHAMQNHGELSSNRDFGFSEPASFGDPHAPGFEHGPFCNACQQNACPLVEIASLYHRNSKSVLSSRLHRMHSGGLSSRHKLRRFATA